MTTNTMSFVNLFPINDTLAEKYSRDRYQFYANLWEALNSPDPTVVDRVLGLEMKNRAQYEKVKESKHDVTNALTYLKFQNTKQPPAPGAGAGAGGGGQRGGAVDGEGEKTWYQQKLEELKGANGATKRDRAEVYGEWQNHPIYSPDVEAVSTTDRIVFIAVTYAFRAITLYLIEWSLHNRMITSFEKAFWYYFFIYVSLFILLVMLVNVNTTSPALRMMFYYLNTDIKGGTLRIYVHCLAQLLLIIIPFILRETSSTSSQTATFLSFEERQNILSVLSRFTLFMWILTSAIALRI